MSQLPLWKISALLLIFPPETLRLIDFAALLGPMQEFVEAVLVQLAHQWHSLHPRRAQSTNMTTSFQRDLLDKLAALVLFRLSSCCWHYHSYSTCLLYKGVSFLNHLNMVCGHTTSNHTLQSNVHTRAHTLRLTRGPYQGCQLVFSSGGKSDKR